MIQLKPDCLIFQTHSGEQVPCSAEWVTLELIGDAATAVDPELIRGAAAAVLHYFKHELRREYVSVGEFAAVLERALGALGLSILSSEPAPELRVRESDLHEVARKAGGGELFFFPHLRNELKRQLGDSPQVVRFNGLRSCVKHLAGTDRWSPRCEVLSDQIVEYLRTCLETDTRLQSCTLVVH